MLNLDLPSSVQTLGPEELARILHKSPATIQAEASRKPGGLPPRLMLPGTNRLLWRRSAVERWLRTYEAGQVSNTKGRNTK